MNELTRYKWGDPIGDLEGRPVYGGDCWSGIPAIYVTGSESTGGRYSETEEEWELFGAHLPHEVEIMIDLEIGCQNYQSLVAAGLAVQECLHCPARQVMPTTEVILTQQQA